MPILPIDVGRYGRSVMKSVFEEESKLQRLLDVEAALAWAHGEVGNIPINDADTIVKKASTKFVKPARVKEIEREIGHDVMSMVRALAEACGSSGAYVHLGATSSDIVDSATALQLKQAVNLVEEQLNNLEEILIEKAKQHRDTMLIGRTHGQHAVPITLGLKLSVWLLEVERHIQRLRESKKRVLVGKMSGAVGTQASFGEHAIQIQSLVMDKLGISSAEVSTQIIQRDRYAELICLFAIFASTLDKIATEIRELQRTEIAELFEPFEKAKQVGSSTMPHKRNPEKCERICGLAKIMRSLVFPALENIPTWHERDITQSSAERFLIPQSCILIDYMLFLAQNILENLEVDEEKMRMNLKLTGGLNMSEALLMALTKKGVSRQKAHELLRKLSIRSKVEKKRFREALLEDSVVKEMLSEAEIDEALDPKNYLGTASLQVESAVQKVLRGREKRGIR